MSRIIDFKAALANIELQNEQVALSVERRLACSEFLQEAIDRMWDEGCDADEIIWVLRFAADLIGGKD